MPELSRFFGIIIAMHFSEHNPPHFHALSGDRRRHASASGARIGSRVMEYSYPIEAEFVEGRKIKLRFADGKEGVVDFTSFIEADTVFERMADDDYFMRFRINPELRVLEWPDGVDIAPEMLYHKSTGTPLPDWMEE
jgi:hypothetical protein